MQGKITNQVVDGFAPDETKVLTYLVMDLPIMKKI
jgi:hypothetical protein